MTPAPKVPVVEVPGEGLLAYLGKPVTLFCANYFYTGVLLGVNDTCVKLGNAHLIYETGPFTTKGWADAQKLPGDEWYVQTVAIESFGGVK